MSHAPASRADETVDLHGRVWAGPDRAPFVLLPGLGVGSRLVAPLATRLRHLSTNLAPDLPGFGASVDLADDAEVGIEPHADTILRWMRARDLAGVTLVAVSVGTQVAARVAAVAPELVDRLVLLSPTIDPAHRSVPDLLLRLPLEQAPNSWTFHRVTLQDQSAAGPRRLWNMLRSAVDDEPERSFPRILAPTLVVRGSLDPLVGRGWAHDVADAIPHGRMHELRRARHAMSFEDAERCARLIEAFLSQTTDVEQPA